MRDYASLVSPCAQLLPSKPPIKGGIEVRRDAWSLDWAVPSFKTSSCCEVRVHIAVTPDAIDEIFSHRAAASINHDPTRGRKTYAKREVFALAPVANELAPPHGSKRL